MSQVRLAKQWTCALAWRASASDWRGMTPRATERDTSVGHRIADCVRGHGARARSPGWPSILIPIATCAPHRAEEIVRLPRPPRREAVEQLWGRVSWIQAMGGGEDLKSRHPLLSCFVSRREAPQSVCAAVACCPKFEDVSRLWRGQLEHDMWKNLGYDQRAVGLSL